MRVFEEYLTGDRELQAPGLWVYEYILGGVGGEAPGMFSNKVYVIFRNEPYTIAILLYCDIYSVNPQNNL